MRFRLGLLQDTAAIEKQIAKDAAEAKKPPTVKTEAQTKADEARKEHEKDKPKDKKKPKIRPLSEAKAIELGANFVSETFLLAVGIALILFENARKGRQEATRREDVADQIQLSNDNIRLLRRGVVDLEKEIQRLRAKDGTLPSNNHRIIPKKLREMEEQEEIEEETKAKGWFPWVQGLFRKTESAIEFPEPFTSKTSEEQKEASNAEPAPPVSTSVLSKILPRSHARDIDPKPTDRPEGPDSTNTSKRPTTTPQKEANPKP